MVYLVSCTAVCYVTVITLFIKKVGWSIQIWGSGPPITHWLHPCCQTAFFRTQDHNINANWLKMTKAVKSTRVVPSLDTESVRKLYVLNTDMQVRVWPKVKQQMQKRMAKLMRASSFAPLLTAPTYLWPAS